MKNLLLGDGRMGFARGGWLTGAGQCEVLLIGPSDATRKHFLGQIRGNIAHDCVEVAARNGLVDAAQCDWHFDLLRNIGLPLASEDITVPLCQEALRSAALHWAIAFNVIAPSGIDHSVCTSDQLTLNDSFFAGMLEEIMPVSCLDL